MEDSSKPRWRTAGLIALGAAAAAAVALQTKRYLEAPVDAEKAGDARQIRIDAADRACAGSDDLRAAVWSVPWRQPGGAARLAPAAAERPNAGASA